MATCAEKSKLSSDDHKEYDVQCEGVHEACGALPSLNKQNHWGADGADTADHQSPPERHSAGRGEPPPNHKEEEES